MLDIATGQTLGRCEAGSSAITVTMGEMYAQAVLEDGYVCNYWYDDNYCYENKCLQSNLSQASISDAFFSLQLYDNQVTIYRDVEPMTLWNYRHEYVVNVLDQRVYDNQWLIQEYNKLHLFDLQNHQICWTVEDSVKELLNFSEDGTRFRYINGNNDLQIIDTATGNVTTESLELGEDYLNDCYVDGDMFFYTANRYTENGTSQALAWMMDLNSKQKTSFEIFSPNEDLIRYSIVGQRNKNLLLWEQNGKIVKLNISGGVCETIAEDVLQCPVIAVKADGTMALTNGEHILVMVQDSNDVMNIAMEDDALAGSVYYYGDDLLVLCDNGYLYRYDSDGLLLSRTELDVSETFSRDLLDIYAATEAKVSYYITSDGKMIVNAFSYGNVIDTDNWTTSTSIPRFQLYREADNMFVCSGNSGICAYQSYSLQELQTLAADKLGNFQMTPEQKSSYGLG